MRTSKKGGRGDSWSVQSGGQAVAPALFPPVSRYESSTASTRSLGGQILRGFGWFLLLVLVIGAGVGGGALPLCQREPPTINGANQGAVIDDG